MNAVEIFAALFGLVAGYLVVSHFVGGSRKASDQNKPPLNQAESEDGWQSPPAWNTVLEVSRAASVDDIRRAYRAQVGKYHPDKVSSLGRELRAVAEAKTKQINAAYHEALREKGAAV